MEGTPVWQKKIYHYHTYIREHADLLHIGEMEGDYGVQSGYRMMCGWLDANPQKRKTRRGIQRFVNAWLTREQDRAGQAQRPADQQRTGSSNPFLNMLEEQK